jgi:hypothetical protein
MCTSNSNLYRVSSNKLSLNSLSSAKRYANRVCIKYIPNPTDKTSSLIYQINSKGKIVKTWENRLVISDFFDVTYYHVTQALKHSIIVGDCLFIKLVDYKSDTDYVKLIKFLKYKQKD